ncbi:hypothetical protein CF319_g1669 [Tilletia indica]|nr:hypothetical protein CF319_g1669 [Tilletia indica]
MSSSSPAVASFPPASSPPPPRSLKLVLIGDGGVGKTTLRSRFLTGRFAPAYRATIGADFLTKTLPLDPEDPASPRVTVSIWDTAGQERFASLGSSFYRGADAVIIAFDSTTSIARIQSRLAYWQNEFLTKTPIPPNENARRFCWVCVGCKTDLLPDDDRDSTLSLKRNQVQAVLDSILPRPGCEVQAEDITSELQLPPPPSQTAAASSSPNPARAIPKSDLKLNLDDTRQDRRKSLPYPTAMAKRASKQSLRSTISVKPLPTPPPPNSAGSASRSRSQRNSPRSYQQQRGSSRESASPALGLTTSADQSSSATSTPTPTAEKRSNPVDVTPTKYPRSLPIPDDSSSLPAERSELDNSSALSIPSPSPSATAQSFPVFTPSSSDSGSSSNPLLYAGGIYVNGKVHKRDRLDSSVSNTSTIYHTPRNSTFFASSPSTHRWGGSGSSVPASGSGSDPAIPIGAAAGEGRARTSLESTRSNGSHPSAGGLQRRTSSDSISSIRTVKGDDGTSSLGHGSNGASLRFGGSEAKERTSGSGRSSLDGPSLSLGSLGSLSDTQVKRKSSLAFSFKDGGEEGEDDENEEGGVDGDGDGSVTVGEDGHEMRNLVRPRAMARRDGSSDTVYAPRPREETTMVGNGEVGDDGLPAGLAPRPQSGISTSTSVTDRSWDQPTPRPGSWAQQAGDSTADDDGRGSHYVAEVEDVEEEDEEDDDEEDEYGLRSTRSAFPIKLDPIPFPTASSSAIYHEPHHLDDDGGSITLGRTQPPNLSLTDTIDGGATTPTTTSGGGGGGGAPSLHQSKKEAAQAEMERWREARSKKRRSRMGTGATRVDSLRMEAEVSSIGSGSGVGRGESNSSEASRSRTVSDVVGESSEDGVGTPSGGRGGAEGEDVSGTHGLDSSVSRRSSIFRPVEAAGTPTTGVPPVSNEHNNNPAVPSSVHHHHHQQSSARPASPTHLDPTDPEPPTLEEGFHLFLTSSKTGTNVSSVFEHVVSRVSARWAYEEWEEREYRRAVREWKMARRLERGEGVGGAGDASKGRKGRWMAIFGRGRQGGRVSGGGVGGVDGEWEDEEDEEEERTRIAVRRAIRVAAGKDSGAGPFRGCCTG